MLLFHLILSQLVFSPGFVSCDVCFCPPLNVHSSVSQRTHTCVTMADCVCALFFRCPVCRYCQTPEPVEENKCFECGVQEVTDISPSVSLCKLIHLCFLLNLSWSHVSLLSVEPVDLSDLRAHRMWSLRQPACLQALWGDTAYVRYAAHQPQSLGLRRRYWSCVCVCLCKQARVASWGRWS